MTYDTKEHDRVLALSRAAIAFHEGLLKNAKASSNPSVEKALIEAADALDAWMQDELTNGVLKIIENMEEDAAVSETIREARVMDSSYRRR